MDGAAASSSRTYVAADFAVPSRTAAPNRAEPSLLAPPEPWARGANAFAARNGLLECGAARPLEMEWHMKRLCQRCGVISDRLAPNASCTLRPEPDWKWVLLWRNNQRHRPPSKR